MNRSVIGVFLSDLLHERHMTNRALAAGAGVSEGVVRNLLLHGIDENAKDPDPRTLRAIGDFLGIDSLRMFRLAGYIDEEDFLTARAEYVALLYDRLSPDKQAALLHILETLVGTTDERQSLHHVRKQPDDILLGQTVISYGKGWSPSTRLMANALLTGQHYIDIDDVSKIGEAAEIWNGRKLDELDPKARSVILDLIKAKLSLDYDLGMRGFKWKP